MLDIGAPLNLVGREWINKHLRQMGVRMEELRSQNDEQVFRFGPGKRYVSKERVEIPVVVKGMDGKQERLKIFAHVIGAGVPFLVGRTTLEDWKSRMDMVKRVLETDMDGEKRNFEMVTTESGHYGIEMMECRVKGKSLASRQRRKERRKKEKELQMKGGIKGVDIL